MKKHLIELTEKENKQLQELKKEYRHNNINDMIKEMISYFYFSLFKKTIKREVELP